MRKELFWFEILTIVFLKGGPRTVWCRLHQNAKQSDTGYLSNLFYIICGHFDLKKKKKRVPPNTGESRHFEKYLHDMDLKLTEHVRNTTLSSLPGKKRVEF